MQYRNLTPHKIEVYRPEQFTNLEWDGKCFYADSVEGDSVLSLPSEGMARVAQTTEYEGEKEGVPFWITYYGELELPEEFHWGNGELLVVSLPTKTMTNASGNPLGAYMVSPYGVVRSRENGSLVLGCQGLTY